MHLQQLLRNFSQNYLQYAARKCQNKDTIQMYLSIWSCAFATIVAKTFHKTLCNTLLGNAKIDTQNKCICQYNLVHLQQLLQNFSQNSSQYAAGKCQNKNTMYCIQMYVSIWFCGFATIVAKLFAKLFEIGCWEMPK